jgi:hypothetical protein
MLEVLPEFEFLANSRWPCLDCANSAQIIGDILPVPCVPVKRIKTRIKTGHNRALLLAPARVAA